MKIDLLTSILESAPLVVEDVAEAVTKVKGDSNLAAKIADGVAALEKLTADLKDILAKL